MFSIAVIVALALQIPIGSSGDAVPRSTLASEAATAANDHPTLAIIDVSTDRPSPDGLAELVQAELSHRGLRLVERDSIGRILGEQNLQLSFGDSADSTRVQALGRLVAADLLLLIDGKTIETNDEARRTFRLRLVESQYGLKLADEIHELEPDRQDVAVRVAHIAGWVATHASRLPQIRKQLYIIGVSSFLSEEISKQWNWLSDVLPAGLEHRLSTASGIVLAERHQTGRLMDERTLAAGLPEALRASMMLIEGSFRIDREQGPDVLVVRVCGRRGTEILFETSVQGNIKSTDELTTALAAAICEKLGRTIDLQQSDRATEAEQLIAQGQAYLRIGDTKRAVAPLEAAIALAPSSIAAKMLLIDATSLYNERDGWPWGIERLSGDRRESFIREAVPALLRNLSLAEQVLGQSDSWLTSQEDWQLPSHRDRILERVLPLFSYPPLVQRYLGAEAESASIISDMRPALRSIHSKVLATTGGPTDRFYGMALQESVGSGLWWSTSPEEYLDLVQVAMEKLANAASTGQVRCIDGLYFRLRDSPFWTDRGDLEALHTQFLNRLSNHENRLIRAAAQLSFVRFYAQVPPVDHDQARKHYRQLIDILVSEVIPRHPELEGDIPLWASAINTGLEIEPLERGRLLARVVRAQLERGMRRHTDAWEMSIRPAVEAFEAAGNPQEAESLLEFAIDKGVPTHQEKLIGWLQSLRERHPQELKPVVENVTPTTFSVERVWTLSDLNGLLTDEQFPTSQRSLRRLIAMDDGISVAVASDSAAVERIGLIRLTLDTLRPARVEVCDQDVRLDSNSYNIQTKYGHWGPESTANSGTVYLGFPQAGILQFPMDGRPTAITEQTGLPSNEIRRLEFMRGRLYMVCGPSIYGNAVVEFDVATRTSRILLSDKDGLLDGRSIYSWLADSRQGVLWMALNSNRGGVPGGVYRYDPSSGTAEFVMSEGNSSTQLWWNGDRIGMRDSSRIGMFDPSTKQIEWLLLPASPNDHSIAAQWKFRVSLGPVTPVRTGFVGIGLEPGRGQQLFFFSKGRPTPTLMRGDLLPAADQIRGLQSTKQGLLLITENALYRLPELE